MVCLYQCRAITTTKNNNNIFPPEKQTFSQVKTRSAGVTWMARVAPKGYTAALVTAETISPKQVDESVNMHHLHL